MSKKTGAFDMVRELGLALPEVEEGTTYGSPALKVNGKMFACLAINRSAEPDSLVAQVDFVNRDLLISKDPRTYYVTHHYAGGPVVLVRLRRIGREELQNVLQMAWRYVSGAGKRRTGKRKCARRTGRGSATQRSPTPTRSRQ